MLSYFYLLVLSGRLRVGATRYQNFVCCIVGHILSFFQCYCSRSCCNCWFQRFEGYLLVHSIADMLLVRKDVVTCVPPEGVAKASFIDTEVTRGLQYNPHSLWRVLEAIFAVTSVALLLWIVVVTLCEPWNSNGLSNSIFRFFNRQVTRWRFSILLNIVELQWSYELFWPFSERDTPDWEEVVMHSLIQLSSQMYGTEAAVQSSSRLWPSH